MTVRTPIFKKHLLRIKSGYMPNVRLVRLDGNPVLFGTFLPAHHSWKIKSAAEGLVVAAYIPRVPPFHHDVTVHGTKIQARGGVIEEKLQASNCRQLFALLSSLNTVDAAHCSTTCRSRIRHSDGADCC